MPRLIFGPHADPAALPDHARQVLLDALAHSGNEVGIVTSLSRTPFDLARIMFHNLETQGVEAQRELYLAPGRAVIDVYAQCKAAGRDERTTRAAMELKIIEVGPTKVSHHCCDPKVLSVADLDPRPKSADHPDGLSNPTSLETAIVLEMRPGGQVSKFLRPSSHDPAFHIEIPIPRLTPSEPTTHEPQAQQQ